MTLPAHALPPHVPVPVPVSSHARHGSTSSMSSISQFQQPPPSQPQQPIASTSNTQVNQTRIILLSQFSPQLKTKDLVDLVSEYVPSSSSSGAQDTVTPAFKLKWRDDTSCFVVFSDPSIAKRTFLRLVSSPPTPLSPRETGTYSACIHAYTGEDSAQIIQAVQNKQRTRSIAGMGAVSGNVAGAPSSSGGGHQRKSSLMGSQGGGANAPPVPPIPSSQHHRTASWTRHSIDRRSAAPQLVGGASASPNNHNNNNNNGGPSSPSRGRNSPAHSGAGAAADSWRASSPDVMATVGGASGIVAGEAPRRFGQASPSPAAASQ
ncbi:hypothetical protein JCM10908_002226 [Rhodotorula pacifica]|uniref:uncharacterized protein n=1 Tax=Rhodotorula pacifica TaxID=1495444 RepID=UPI00317BEB73